MIQGPSQGASGFAQIAAVFQLEWKKTFLSRRAWWIYLLAAAPVGITFLHYLIALRFPNGDIYLGVYEVDPAATPPAMDMTIDDGPDQYRGMTALCLYELDGDTLRWSPNEPGNPRRHAAFPPEDQGKWPTLRFRRDGAD